MTTSTTPRPAPSAGAPPPRRRWTRALAAAVLLLALVVGVVYYFAGQPDPAAPAPASPPVQGAPEVGALPDGCLGGSDPVKAIRIAREKAPLTTLGAAEFLATYLRWRGQVPHDPDEFRQTGQLLWAPSLPAKDRQPLPPAAAGATGWVDTTDARWRLVSAEGDDITLDVLVPGVWVQDGETRELTHAGRLTVTAIDGHWALKGSAGGDQSSGGLISALQAEGLPYRAGC